MPVFSIGAANGSDLAAFELVCRAATSFPFSFCAPCETIAKICQLC
jgi:hypothetical protein